MCWLNPVRGRSAARAADIVAALILIAALPLATRDAHAGFKVYLPYVETNELEIEYRPSVTSDGDDAKDNAQKHLLGFGYGINDWWFTEIYGAWERDAGTGEKTSFAGFEWENKFQLTNPGEYWADLGLLVEYARADPGSTPDELAVSLLLAKQFGKLQAAYNLEFNRRLGSGAADDVNLEHRFQLKYRLDPHFEPAIEVFGAFGALGKMPGFDRQEHYVGPVIEGAFALGDSGLKLKYNASYLFGVSDEAADGVVKAIVELEVPLS